MTNTYENLYQDFLKAKETTDDKTIAKLRLRLIRYIFNGDRDFITNEIFLKLLEEEFTYLKSNPDSYYKSQLYAPIKAARMYRGLEELNIQEVKDIYALEYNAKFDIRTADTSYITWFIEIILNTELTDSEIHSAVYVLFRAEGTDANMNGIQNTFFDNPADISIYNDRVHRAIEEEQDFGRSWYDMMSETCITLFLFNKSIGEDSTANYFLMKAIQFENEIHSNKITPRLLKAFFLS